jgi:hypothetical protein
MNRFARDSRKWNVRVLLSSQIPADFLKIQGFVALLDSVFVGRLDDDDAQADALRLLKVPVGVGYEQVVAALGRRPGAQRGLERDVEPRQFIFGDGAGGVERIRVDFSGPHLDHLRAVMDTTPGSPDAKTKPGSELVAKKEDRPKPHVPTPPEEDIELEQDFELEAELEVGLADESLLGSPDPLATETGEVEGKVQPEENGRKGEHAKTGGKGGGTGRDAA